MKCLRKKRGFTLIELLVVIAILSILATGLIVLINPTAKIQQANDTKRKNDLTEIQHALQLYYQDFGHYPSSQNYQICVQSDSGCTVIDWDGRWLPYMAKLPTDPGNFKYQYVSEGGDQYYLYAHMENWKNDPHVCHPSSATDTVCDQASGATCGSTANAICDYGVSSPNVSP